MRSSHSIGHEDIPIDVKWDDVRRWALPLFSDINQAFCQGESM